MISAQIKKGKISLITNLQKNLLSIVIPPPNHTQKTIKFTFSNFIECIIELINQYSMSQCSQPFNLFITDFYVSKFWKNSVLYRYFLGLTQSWKKFVESEDDAKLFLSLLTDARNNRQTLKLFMKIRKIILKTSPTKALQQITITHSDSITICHMLFNGDDRNQVIKILNTLFLTLTRQLINPATINGAVACQFFMTATQKLQVEHSPDFPDKIQQTSGEIKGEEIKNVEKKKKSRYELSFYDRQLKPKVKIDTEKFQQQKQENSLSIKKRTTKLQEIQRNS